jgi:hypothetical protein
MGYLSMTGIMRKKTKVETFIHTWSVILKKNHNANPNTRAHLQPQKTTFPTNSALFLVLLTAKSETSARGKINTVKIDINRNIQDSYASCIKFVGTMGCDFKKGTIP